MREIKYKIWDREKRKWVDTSFYFINPDGSIWWNIGGLEEGVDGLIEILGDNLILVQFTGLKDKAGREVYEGDIIRYPNPNVKDIVRFGIFDNRIDFDSMERGNGWYLKRIGEENEVEPFMSAYKIIGNIYENPELLEGENDQTGI